MLKISSNLLKYYREKGYNVSNQKYSEIKVKDLTKGSHVKVNGLCDDCDCEFIREYRTVKYIDGKTYCKKCQASISAKKRIKEVGSNFGKSKSTPFSNPEIQRKIATKYSKNPKKLKEIHNKRKKTRYEKYGDENWNNQKKKKETSMIKHGTENWNNPEKRKATCLKKHGNKTWNNQEKKKETCLERYGVEHTQHNEEIFNKTLKSAHKVKEYKNGIFYQGSYEMEFLDLYWDRMQILNGKKFIYIGFDGNQHVYFSDFYIPSLNLIVEIKSQYTLDYDSNSYYKHTTVKNSDYNFICIIDKIYDEFESLLK